MGEYEWDDYMSGDSMNPTDLALGVAIGAAASAPQQPAVSQCILVDGKTYCPESSHCKGRDVGLFLICILAFLAYIAAPPVAEVNYSECSWFNWRTVVAWYATPTVLGLAYLIIFCG